MAKTPRGGRVDVDEPAQARPVDAQNDNFIARLERAITETLNDSKASQRAKATAIANGIKLAAIKHKVGDGDGGGGSFFPDD